MTTMIDIGSLIESSPEIHGGRPCVAGTGVTVGRVARWYKLGWSPEEIARRMGDLPLAKVYAALTYYQANQAAMEATFAAEDAEYDRLEREHLAAREKK